MQLVHEEVFDVLAPAPRGRCIAHRAKAQLSQSRLSRSMSKEMGTKTVYSSGLCWGRPEPRPVEEAEVVAAVEEAAMEVAAASAVAGAGGGADVAYGGGEAEGKDRLARGAPNGDGRST